MKKLLIFMLTMLCLVSALTACGQKSTGGQTDAAESAAAEDTAGESTEETHTISGIVNRLDDYLVLLDDGGDYHIFDFGADIDQASLEEGDSVTVTYTGTLDSDDPAPVATVIEKAE